MSVIAAIVVVGVPALVILLAVVLSNRNQTMVSVSREWRAVRLIQVLGLVGGVLVAWLVADALDLGRGLMLVPAIVGLGVVSGVALGETVVRPARPDGPRTASLNTRRVASYLPSGLAGLVAAVLGAHAATLALTSATASADDLGRAGRQVVARCGNISSGAGPYPGSFYSAPVAAVLLLICVVAALAITIVVRRPRGLAADEIGDDVLRRRSVSTVLGAVGAAVAVSHAGIAFFAGTALRRMDCQAEWMDPVAVVLLASVPVVVVLLGWFLVRTVAAGSSNHLRGVEQPSEWGQR